MIRELWRRVEVPFWCAAFALTFWWVIFAGLGVFG
jgi:hypothetical protein